MERPISFSAEDIRDEKVGPNSSSQLADPARLTHSVGPCPAWHRRHRTEERHYWSVWEVSRRFETCI